MAQELALTGAISDQARGKVTEPRESVAASWVRVAEAWKRKARLELGGDVRHFVKTLPRAPTDREQLATQLVEHMRDDDLVR